MTVTYDMRDYYGGGWSPNKFKWYGILLLLALVGRWVYLWWVG